jgi:BTB/POZ domain.
MSSSNSYEAFYGQQYYPHNSDRTDFLILCGGRKFYVHKDMLIKESDYFQTVVKGTFEESRTGKLYLKEIKPEVSTPFWRIYTPENCNRI